MRFRTPILTIALMLPLMAALPSAASIPEDSNTGAESIDGGAIADARQLFVSRKFQVRGVGENNTVLLYDELGRKTHKLKLSKQIKLRAVSKKEFAGRKKLAFADFSEGQRVKVDIRKSDGRILRIDFLPKADYAEAD